MKPDKVGQHPYKMLMLVSFLGSLTYPLMYPKYLLLRAIRALITGLFWVTNESY